MFGSFVEVRKDTTCKITAGVLCCFWVSPTTAHCVLSCQEAGGEGVRLELGCPRALGPAPSISQYGTGSEGPWETRLGTPEASPNHRAPIPSSQGHPLSGSAHPWTSQHRQSGPQPGLTGQFCREDRHCHKDGQKSLFTLTFEIWSYVRHTRHQVSFGVKMSKEGSDPSPIMALHPVPAHSGLSRAAT